MTNEENALWYKFLKDLPVRFLRQKVIYKYIVDFYCASKRIIIELDGSQHYTEDSAILEDFKRDEYLKSKGYKVLRYTNSEVNNQFDSVCEDILRNLSLL